MSSFSVEEGVGHTRKVLGLAFEGRTGGNGLAVLTAGLEGNDAVALERWRSSQEPQAVHEVFKGGEDGKDGPEGTVTWDRTASVELQLLGEGTEGLGDVGLTFSSTGDQLAISTASCTHLLHVR